MTSQGTRKSRHIIVVPQGTLKLKNTVSLYRNVGKDVEELEAVKFIATPLVVITEQQRL